MIRLLLIVLRPLVVFGHWIGGVWARLDTIDRTRRALPSGTVVMLQCHCHLPSSRELHQPVNPSGETERGPHSGIWTIDRYCADADDYHLVRYENDEPVSTYATRDAFLVIGQRPGAMKPQDAHKLFKIETGEKA